MKPLTRRLFLAASAATIARPAFGAVAPSGDADAVIVGAGAAGIAAARRLVAAGRRVTLVEATDHVGGRCVTDTKTFGVPFDRGAHWIYRPDVNPLAKLAPGAGLNIYPAPPGQRLRIGRRNARDGELEDFLSLLVKANRAIADAAKKGDIGCAQALPRDLGEYRALIEFTLGPYGAGKELSEISAVDFARSAERDTSAFCRQGYGALLAKLAEGIPVQLSAPVTQIDSGGKTRVEVKTAKGTFAARYAIVTVSTDVLTSGKIKIDNGLPKRQLDAAASLKLGSFDHIALELDGNPLGLQRDDLVFEKTDGAPTAALLANVSGSTLAMVDVAGKFGRDLGGKGEAGMVDFATGWLANLYGTDIKKAVNRSQATRWNDDPWTLGAFSSAAPGAAGARRVLTEVVRDRLYFAGEATHETLWGTVGGAWESGERAAEAVLRRLGVLKDPEEPKPERSRRKRS